MLFPANQFDSRSVGYAHSLLFCSNVFISFLGMDAGDSSQVYRMDGNAYEHVAWIYSLPARRLYVWHTYKREAGVADVCATAGSVFNVVLYRTQEHNYCVAVGFGQVVELQCCVVGMRVL